MAYTNMHITDTASERKALAMREAERKFWEEYAFELQRKLENIPRAIKEFGFVDIELDGEEVRLVSKQQDGE